MAAIISLLLHYKWHYVSLFYSDTVIGQDYREQFQQQAKNASICITSSEELKTYDANNLNRDRLQKWLEGGWEGSVVVLLAEAVTLKVSFLLSTIPIQAVESTHRITLGLVGPDAEVNSQ